MTAIIDRYWSGRNCPFSLSSSRGRSLFVSELEETNLLKRLKPDVTLFVLMRKEEVVVTLFLNIAIYSPSLFPLPPLALFHWNPVSVSEAWSLTLEMFANDSRHQMWKSCLQPLKTPKTFNWFDALTGSDLELRPGLFLSLLSAKCRFNHGNIKQSTTAAFS